MKCIVYFY